MNGEWSNKWPDKWQRFFAGYIAKNKNWMW